MALTLPQAQLIGAFLEALFYGVHVMVFTRCVYALRKRKPRSSYHLLGTAISFFVFSTAHLMIDIDRNMDALTSNVSIPDYSSSYYETFDTWENILKYALYVAITIISDAFILYRSFIIWGRSYAITAIPFLLFLADVVIGIHWVYYLSLLKLGDDLFTDAFAKQVKAFYSITFTLNVICTCLIAVRIWTSQKAVAPYAVQPRNRSLSRLVAIIVESGCVYSTLLIAIIATNETGSFAIFIFLNSIPPIIGIVFCSVIVRVGLGLSHGDIHSRTLSYAHGPLGVGMGTRSPMSISFANHTGTSAPRWTVGGYGDGIRSAPAPLSPDHQMGVQVALSRMVQVHVDPAEGEVIGEGCITKEEDLPGITKNSSKLGENLHQAFMVA